MAELTDDEKAVLDFESRGWWKYPGAKESQIRDELGCSATRYYQRLHALLNRPEALAYAPLTVRRLRRLRAARRRVRAG